MNRSNSGPHGVGVTREQKWVSLAADVVHELKRSNDLREEQLRELRRLNDRIDGLSHAGVHSFDFDECVHFQNGGDSE